GRHKDPRQERNSQITPNTRERPTDYNSARYPGTINGPTKISPHINPANRAYSTPLIITGIHWSVRRNVQEADMIAPGIPSLSERMREDATLINYLLTLKRWLTLSANVVVGRPINLLSVLLSSNRPPFDAPTSESASISASPSGRPTLFSAAAK